MSRFTRILVAIAIAAFTAGPISAAAAQNAPNVVAQGASNSEISGTVADDTGAPISGVNVSLRGAASYKGTTDAKGAFSITDVTPGVYVLEATKPGYTAESESGLALVAGQNLIVAVTMPRASLTGLQTIATVRTVGQGTFNTSTAAVGNISSQTLEDQGATQFLHVLNQVPGLQAPNPGGSTNGAAPGAITFPQIRDARSYETLVLIDGHPVSVGDYGDYPSEFWTSFMWGNIEVSKGPGAMVPQVSGAINGSINFKTKDPTYDPTPDYTFGLTSKGGSFLNVGFSDTIDRLGFVVDIANLDEPTPYGTYNAYFSNVGSMYYNGVNLFSNSNNTPIHGTSSSVAGQQALVGCCVLANGNFYTINELLKARYKFSDATTATVSYLGNQAHSDQFGNTGNITDTTLTPVFAPGFSYTGPALNNVPVVYLFPSSTDTEDNFEPIVQGEVSTTLGDDNMIARYYHAGINRLQSQGPNDPNTPENDVYQMWGNQAPFGGTPGLVFNGGSYVFQNYDYFRETEADRLSGESFEYQHPIGDNLLAFSWDRNTSNSNVYEVFANGPAFGGGAFTETVIPQGSTQTFQTYQGRAQYFLGPQIVVNAALYDEMYSTITNNASSGCLYNGTGKCAFQQQNVGHFDGRVAASWRPDPTWAVRFAAGSAITPPYLGLLTATDDTVAETSSEGAFATISKKNPSLQPETAFGYDLGADKRLHDGITYVSADVFLENLFNGYIEELSPTGLNCATFTCKGTGAGDPTYPVYATEFVNLSNVRFEGIELAVKHIPDHGFGWAISGSTQRGYAYHIPASIYCSNPTIPCIPSNYDQNLNLVNGANFNGGSGDGIVNASGTATSGVDSQNTAVPYLQGNLELRYTLKPGAFAMFGETLLGKNNSYNLHPFGIAYATVRYPINDRVAVQISGDNILNAYPSAFPTLGSGIPILLANGQTAAMTGNVVGPAIWRFELTKSF